MTTAAWSRRSNKPLERKNFNRTLLEYPFGISQASCSAPKPRLYPDQPYLQFWTWSAHFRVTPRHGSSSSSSINSSRASAAAEHNDDDDDDDDNDNNGLTRCDILDYCGDWCGTIVLNSAWLASYSKTHQEEGDSVYELLAISEAKNFSDEESDMWTYYIPRDREQVEWHLFYVLLVTRKGDICSRQGLGKVFKDAFSKSFLPGKECKEIIMG